MWATMTDAEKKKYSDISAEMRAKYQAYLRENPNQDDEQDEEELR